MHIVLMLKLGRSLFYVVTYTYQRGFMEVQSVISKGSYSDHGVLVNINSTLFF